MRQHAQTGKRPIDHRLCRWALDQMDNSTKVSMTLVRTAIGSDYTDELDCQLSGNSYLRDEDKKIISSLRKYHRLKTSFLARMRSAGTSVRGFNQITPTILTAFENAISSLQDAIDDRPEIEGMLTMALTEADPGVATMPEYRLQALKNDEIKRSFLRRALRTSLDE